MAPVGEHGQGTITRRADGRLQVSVTLLDGRRVYRYVPKDRDAKRQMRRAEKARRDLLELRERDLEPERRTLAEYLAAWITALHDARRPLARRTLDHYRYVVDDYIVPTLGDHRLDQLSERHVQAWLDSDTGSPRSVRHHHAVLRRALNVAVRQRLIARNPALAVELPDVPAFHGDALTADEARTLVAATADDHLGPLWRLALVSGLRESELLGLKWPDIDLDAGSVTVRGQLLRADGAWHRVATKAARSVETISLDPGTVAVLRAHRAAMARTDWVFVTPRGQPYGRAEILRAFHDACDAAGIRRRRFHDLRVSAATLMAEAGIAENVRMARLGHATTRMARHYAQVRDVLDREASDALGRMLA